MLIREESPYGINLYLAEPSDNAGGEPVGQDSEPVIDTADPIDVGEPAEPSHFYSYEDDEGKKTDFKDANEVNDFIKKQFRGYPPRLNNCNPTLVILQFF